MNEYTDEESFYAGMEDHLRKLHAGGWAPESIPGRNAEEEFTKWLNHIKATAWDEGYMVDYDDEMFEYGWDNEENPYRSTE